MSITFNNAKMIKLLFKSYEPGSKEELIDRVEDAFERYQSHYIEIRNFARVYLNSLESEADLIDKTCSLTLKEHSADDSSNQQRQLLKKQMKFLVACLLELRHFDGYHFSDKFEHAPTEEELPIYYELVETPMDIDSIRAKIRNNEYASIDDMQADVELMCSNMKKCCCFEDSQLYWDAVFLQNYFNSYRQRLEPTGLTEKQETWCESFLKQRVGESLYGDGYHNFDNLRSFPL